MASQFNEAYNALLARWPQPVESVDVTTPYGPTRVNVCGREGGTPLVLLPGGGSTSAAWFAVAHHLAPQRRLYAVDIIGDAGHSRAEGAPLRRPNALMDWLDTTLAQCGLRFRPVWTLLRWLARAEPCAARATARPPPRPARSTGFSAR
jgi:hypothetical protein